jgi:hypothetical protein
MGIGFLQGEKQLVIAKWTPMERAPGPSRESLEEDGDPLRPQQPWPQPQVW